jgi:hypothetical protein
MHIFPIPPAVFIPKPPIPLAVKILLGPVLPMLLGCNPLKPGPRVTPEPNEPGNDEPGND